MLPKKTGVRSRGPLREVPRRGHGVMNIGAELPGDVVHGEPGVVRTMGVEQPGPFGRKIWGGILGHGGQLAPGLSGG